MIKLKPRSKPPSSGDLPTAKTFLSIGVPRDKNHIPKPVRKEYHVSECYLKMYPGPDTYCTCLDESPEWTIG